MNEIPEFLDRRPLVGTYTLLNTFKNVCEHQCYRRYVKRDQPYVETEAMKWGNAVHEAMKQRVGAGVVLPDEMRQWEKYAEAFDAYNTVKTELQLGIDRQANPVDFWASDVWFRGKIDVPVLVNDKALITDWKTGSSKFENPFELETNALLLKCKFPELRAIVGRYIYLKENRAGQMYDLSNFAKTWDTIGQLMANIADKTRNNNWIKKKSGLCGFCSVKDCEHYFVARP